MARKAATNATPARMRERFLATLAKTANISQSARAAGVDRATPYRWRDDPEFAAAWDVALEQALELLEQTAWERAVKGVKEPVIGRVAKDQDGIITYVQRYSDTLLTTLLKAHKPEKYRERMEHEHRGSIAVEFVNNWHDEADA